MARKKLRKSDAMISLRIPSDLLVVLNRMAYKEGVSRSKVIIALLVKAVGSP